MEDTHKFLEQYALNSSDSDSDVSFDSLESKTNPSGAFKRQEGRNIRKRPTRCPDPNVYNRNALLARENRRKKKVYLEALEKELEETRVECKQLSKALKKQMKITRHLEKEKMYFKNVLINRTEIVNLISALNEHITKPFASNSFSVHSQKTSVSSESSLGTDYRSSRSSSYDQAPISINFENSSNGRVPANKLSEDPLYPDIANNFFEHFPSDFETPTPFENTWNELLEEDFGLKNGPQTLEPIHETNHSIANEHSYVSYRDDAACKDNPVGVCLHVSQGKVSLEFCPTCHWNAYRTPPTQLLKDESQI